MQAYKLSGKSASKEFAFLFIRGDEVVVVGEDGRQTIAPTLKPEDIPFIVERGVYVEFEISLEAVPSPEPKPTKRHRQPRMLCEAPVESTPESISESSEGQEVGSNIPEN